MGRALVSVGKKGKAIAHLKKAIAIDPRIVDPFLMLAKLCLDEGQFDAAEGYLRRALTIEPNSPSILNNLGSLLAQYGNANEGLKLLDKALSQDASNPLTHYNLANALKACGEFERAIPHYRQAAEMQPNFHSPWHNLGNLLIDVGRIEEAAEAYRCAVNVKRRPGGPEQPRDSFRKTNRTKLKHDIEQFEYLVNRHILPSSLKSTADLYRAVLAALPPTSCDTEAVEIPANFLASLRPTYNRLVHWGHAPKMSESAVNSQLNRAEIELDYSKNTPGFTHVDSFLTPTALDRLRRFCLESTIWYQFRYANGYLGAFMDDGFCCPLLLQIAEELRQSLPGIFETHTLRKLWAFKYDSRLSGIPIHADFAAVNVNFWITPDSANLDCDSGGLTFWDREAPLDWDFETYNANESAIRRFLRESGARAVNVPHRQNRVVIFNSDLFHETGEINFKDGYENRRINITMLFGKRGG